MITRVKARSSALTSSWAARLSVLVVTTSFALLLVPALASAAAPQHHFLETFGSANEPEFIEANQMAVDQATGDVLVIDRVAGTISRFHEDGTPAEFPARGSNEITGLFFGASYESEIAVDNSGGPADGDIYVPQTGAQAVKVYSRNGELLDSLSEYKEGQNASGALTPFSEPCGVAVDPSGNVYVGDFSGSIHKYAPSANPPVNTDNTANLPFGENCLLAAGAGSTRGSIFAAKYLNMGGVFKLNATTGAEEYEVSPNSALAISVDPSTGHLFSIEEKEAVEYNAFGSAAARKVSSTLLGSAGHGVAVNGSSENLYLTTNGTKVEVFAVGPVEVETNAADNVKAFSGTLNGALNPNGITDCHFDYTTHEEFEANGFTGASTANCVPEPGSGVVPVSANVSGLSADTAYDFRLVAISAQGTTTGAVKSFTTAPIAFADPATTIHRTDLVLNGHFDPSGDPGITACEFEWGADTSYSETPVPCSQGNSFSGPANVSALINELDPNATYHYWLKVTTTDHGESASDDETATALSFPVLPAEEIASFGADGTSGSSFGSDGPRALALAPSSERLFASDGGVPGVYGFDTSAFPSFSPLGAFNPLSTVIPGNVPGLAVDDSRESSNGNVYYSSFPFPVGNEGTGLVYGFDASGNPLGGNFPIDFATNPGGTPDEPSALAVDSSGDLWVSNESKRILHYNAAGQFQGSIDTSSLTPEGNPFGIAFDTDENLYVEIGTSSVWKFTAASGYSPSSATKLISGGGFYVAVDPSSGAIYTSGAGQAKAYDSSGNHLYDIGKGIDGFNPQGVAVDPTTHDLYVADEGNHKVRVFAPGAVELQPTVTTGAASAINGSSATLSAKVDPEGFVVTDCHFELVPDEQFEDSGYQDVTTEEEVPCEQDPGDGSGDVAVSANASSLKGGSKYHFRVVASNANPHSTAAGADASFETTGPTVSGESVSDVSSTTATLHASVNPHGAETTFQFEYVTEAAFQAEGFAGAAKAPATPATIEAGPSAVAVAQPVSGLEPATAYRFRLVATNTDATVQGFGITFATYASPPTFGSCGNDGFRTGSGAALPDCRAYEQASPVDKAGSSVQPGRNLVRASLDGDRVTFDDSSGLPTNGGSTDTKPYIASRGTDSWSSRGTVPLVEAGYQASMGGWSEDLSATVSSTVGASGQAIEIGDTATETWHQAYSTAGSLGSSGISLVGFAGNSSHLLFESNAALAPGAIEDKQNLYDLDNDALTLAGRVPTFPATSCNDETHAPDCVDPTEGSVAGPYNFTHYGGGSGRNEYYSEGFVSSDGSKAFFTDSDTEKLYVREDNVRTTQVNVSQASSPDPNGEKPAAWMAATPSGSVVFFTSCEKLTDDSTAVSTSADSCTETAGSPPHAVQGSDLYAYDTETGELTDLTVDSSGSDPRGADVVGVLGASADGSDVYFAAAGVLADGATPGSCTIRQEGGACNIYLSHEGSISFIAQVNDASRDWLAHFTTGTGADKTSRVSASGALVFTAREKLSSYDNQGATEIYRYAPGDAAPTCVSCNPTGAAPVENVEANAMLTSELGTFGGRVGQFLTRNISSDGKRVFFQTPDALVSSDVNGNGGCPQTELGRACTDVYEWEANGSGSCESEAENGGCLYLISTGTGTDASVLGDVSASGDDAFFFTYQQLVPQDKDSNLDVYDARVEGGLASQHPASPAAPCEGEACRGQGSTAPSSQGAGTAAFHGPGNPPTEKPKKHKKKHKKHAKKHHHKRAHAKKGGGK